MINFMLKRSKTSLLIKLKLCFFLVSLGTMLSFLAPGCSTCTGTYAGLRHYGDDSDWAFYMGLLSCISFIGVWTKDPIIHVTSLFLQSIAWICVFVLLLQSQAIVPISASFSLFVATLSLICIWEGPE